MDNDKYSIKFVTYNIHSGKNYWMKPTLNEIIKYLKRENPDIISVQEVNESKKRGFQVSQIQEALNYNFHFGANVKKTNLNYGIATFSSFPIIEKNIYFYLAK
ncbi:endonuclease/exonuclease/phosphatase family protein [Tepidibacter formicigenes]|jgi:endonuclease/exonuclease/phosphatase family metal-dependent hydrolase|uniref:Endonuclease/Exonuclease/phosphatase family protein n=1 Tax=Tepidibacter formicigenes DSM 15518 TaxID=1123349 RepID=A0A1M6K2W0_9FIRM|nr:endonuclease/exonuclease/phosphatase family protein [Tepidibacter formicigenes]SHJ53267.1 Endonuclease/Exonuclease/phosphatase family protein [Tepidibacter formicigenes DSM 15518]